MTETSKKTWQNDTGALKKRVAYLEKSNQWHLFALEILSSLGDIHGKTGLNPSPDIIFKTARKHLKRLIRFKTAAFFTVDSSDSAFVLADCDPESDREYARREVDRQIEKGTFAWALRQNRALLMPSDSSRDRLLVNVMASKSQIRGVFIGRLDKKYGKISSECLTLISLIIHNTAHALESATLCKLLSDQNRDLEKTVQQRTAELQRSNQELQDFASIASHDLKEPLRKVNIFSDLLKSEYSQALDARGKDYLARMQKAVGRMQQFIDDLLQYSKVHLKARPFETVDLGEVVGEVCASLERRIVQTGGRVEAKPLPVIDADRMQMRQLFRNLISNALKFHRKDAPPS